MSEYSTIQVLSVMLSFYMLLYGFVAGMWHDRRSIPFMLVILTSIVANYDSPLHARPFIGLLALLTASGAFIYYMISFNIEKRSRK
jgi:hypothetical protein